MLRRPRHRQALRDPRRHQGSGIPKMPCRIEPLCACERLVKVEPATKDEVETFITANSQPGHVNCPTLSGKKHRDLLKCTLLQAC